MSRERKSNITVYISSRYLDKVDAIGARSFIFERAIEKLMGDFAFDPEKFEFVKEKVSKKTYARAVLGSATDALGIIGAYGAKMTNKGIEYNGKIHEFTDNIEQLLSILLEDEEK